MTEPKVAKKGHFRKHWVFYSMLLVAIGGMGYQWFHNHLQIKSLTEAHQKDIIEVFERADSLLLLNAQQSRELTSKALGWAVAPLVQKNDLNTMDQYFDQIVKYKGIKEVTFFDVEKGAVVSSNERHINRSLIDVYQVNLDLLINESQTVVSDKYMLICQPVISKNNISGTMVMAYELEDLKLDRL